MIDLHTHLLWDWDDGPDDRDKSLEMSRMALADGIKTVVVTPHVFRLTRYGDKLDLLQQRKLEFEQMASEIGLEARWGAEVFIRPDIVSTVEKHKFMIENTSYVFIEFPSELVPAGAAHIIAELMNRGFVPIISHPERNKGFREQPELLYRFVVMGCVAQITAGSITGEFGREVKKASELFLVHNLVQVIASDAHGLESRRPVLSQAVREAARVVGEVRSHDMVTVNPAAIINDQTLPDYYEPRNPVSKKRKVGRLTFWK